MEKIKLALLYSLQKGKKSFWKLLAENQFLLKDFIQAVNELYENGLIEIENHRLKLSKKGRALVNSRASLFRAKLCSACGGKIFVPEGKFKEIEKAFKKISKHHPPILAEFYQGRIVPSDTVARVAFMHACNDLADKSIALIGDDDLLSIALALTNLPERVAVFDIDKRLGDFIERVCKKYRLEIEFCEYDVANPLPKNYVKKFDVFSCEPLETDTGFKAFFARGAACLRDYGSGYIGLTKLEVSMKRWMKFEKLFLDNGFVITDIVRDYSWYYDSEREEEREEYQRFAKLLKFDPGKPDALWYKASLIRIESLGKHGTAVPWNRKIKIIPVDQESYTHPSLHR